MKKICLIMLFLSFSIQINAENDQNEIDKNIKALKYGTPAEIEIAINNLNNLKSKESVDELIILLNHNDNKIQQLAVKTLCNIGDSKAINPVRNYLIKNFYNENSGENTEENNLYGIDYELLATITDFLTAKKDKKIFQLIIETKNKIEILNKQVFNLLNINAAWKNLISNEDTIRRNSQDPLFFEKELEKFNKKNKIVMNENQYLENELNIKKISSIRDKISNCLYKENNYTEQLVISLILIQEYQALEYILSVFNFSSIKAMNFPKEIIEYGINKKNSGIFISYLKNKFIMKDSFTVDEKNKSDKYSLESLSKMDLNPSDKAKVRFIFEKYLTLKESDFLTGNNSEEEKNIFKNYFLELRQISAYGLGMHGDKNSLKVLVNTMENDENDKVRGIAALSIARIGDKTVIKHLETMIKDQSDYVRGCSLYAYGCLAKDKKNKIDVNLIKYRFDNDASITVKLFSAAILIEISQDKDGIYKKFISETAENTEKEEDKELAVKLKK